MKIVLEKLSKEINKNIILNEIDITLEGGKIYGLMGRNGSGKSVLINIICGFMKQTKGNVNFIDCSKNNIGIVLDSITFLDDLTGFENLKLLAKIKKKIDDDKIREVLNLMDLNNNKTYKEYSLGMKQKLAIAQAIMEDQNVILLDEGFNALDSDSIKKMKEVLLSLKNENRIILLSSHVMDDFKNLVDEIYLLKDGKLEKS